MTPVEKENQELRREIAEIEKERDRYKEYFVRISTLHDCNDCGMKGQCKYEPRTGEHCRINCPHWARNHDEAIANSRHWLMDEINKELIEGWAPEWARIQREWGEQTIAPVHEFQTFVQKAAYDEMYARMNRELERVEWEISFTHKTKCEIIKKFIERCIEKRKGIWDLPYKFEVEVEYTDDLLADILFGSGCVPKESFMITVSAEYEDIKLKRLEFVKDEGRDKSVSRGGMEAGDIFKKLAEKEKELRRQKNAEEL